MNDSRVTPDAGVVHGNAGIRAALEVGDTLHGHPCLVKVTSLQGDYGPSIGEGWCHHCKAGHIVDVALFNSGRGPWKRVPDLARCVGCAMPNAACREDYDIDGAECCHRCEHQPDNDRQEADRG